MERLILVSHQKSVSQRELLEELGIQVCLEKSLPPSTHNYPNFAITLYPFVCTITSGEIVLHEHTAINWLPPEELHTLDWAEADVPVIELYLADWEPCSR